MSDRSAIEWTDASWNPLRVRLKPSCMGAREGAEVGWHCEHVSEGCRNCYAEGINRRLGTGLDYKPGHRADLEFFLDEKTLLQPLHWKKPRRIFVGSMTDIFGEWVNDEQLLRIFGVMAHAPQHTFQVLTKRAERMREWCDQWARQADSIDPITGGYEICDWPLPNVWLGVSCEDQATADERVPHLLATPAAVRFISAEPLLGPINLKRITIAGHGWQDVLEGWRDCRDYPGRENTLDWVIAGGESGPNARPVHPSWLRSLRHQCGTAPTAFFFKQWGAFAPAEGFERGVRSMMIDRNGRVPPGDPTTGEGTAEILREAASGRYTLMAAVGKKRAGRLLDGVEHNGMPAP